MNRTTRPDSGDTTLNDDGTVTVWDCLKQSWVRGRNPSAGLLATLDRDERNQVLSHVEAGDTEPLGHEGEYGMYLCDDCCEYVSVDDSQHVGLAYLCEPCAAEHKECA